MREAPLSKPICCPTFDSDCQPQKHFAFSWGPGLPQSTPRFKGHSTKEISFIGRFGGVTSASIKPPNVTILLISQSNFFERVKAISMRQSHNCKNSLISTQDKPPWMSLGHSPLLRASATIRVLCVLGGTHAKTVGTRLSIEQPCSQRSKGY